MVDTSWCMSCTGSRPVSLSWAHGRRQRAAFHRGAQRLPRFASPILVDLTGSGVNDVVVGSSGGLYPLDGATGEYLFGTTETSAINGCSVQNSPAVADILGTGTGAGWHLFEACGGPKQVILSGRLFDFPLPRLRRSRHPGRRGVAIQATSGWNQHSASSARRCRGGARKGPGSRSVL